MIAVNDKIPAVLVKYLKNNEVEEINFRDYITNKKVVVFGVPGAFTPTCSNLHLPGFAEKVEVFKDMGINEIICLSVNDIFVLKAWAQHYKVEQKINFIADGNAELTTAMGLVLDATPFGMGVRSQRYSMYIDSGVVRVLNVEPSSGACVLSTGTTLIDQITHII